jgi:hypothetical protein
MSSTLGQHPISLPAVSVCIAAAPARRERTEQERLAGMNISIDGLGKEAIARIELIGFEAWLDEVCDAPSQKAAKTPQARLCRSGSKCLKAVRRKAAPVTGRSQFCSSACAASFNARLRRKERK